MSVINNMGFALIAGIVYTVAAIIASRALNDPMPFGTAVAVILIASGVAYALKRDMDQESRRVPATHVNPFNPDPLDEDECKEVN